MDDGLCHGRLFTLFFEMARDPVCVTVMGTQNFRWYQLEEGSSSEFGNTVTEGCCFPQKISSPISFASPSRSVPSYGRAQRCAAIPKINR